MYMYYCNIYLSCLLHSIIARFNEGTIYIGSRESLLQSVAVQRGIYFDNNYATRKTKYNVAR